MSDSDLVNALQKMIKDVTEAAERCCRHCGKPIVRVERRQIVFHPTMPRFTEWMHEGWERYGTNDGNFCTGGSWPHAQPREAKVGVERVRDILEQHIKEIS